MKFWLLIQRAFDRYKPFKFVITHDSRGRWYVAVAQSKLKKVGPYFTQPQDVHKFLEMLEHGDEATFNNTTGNKSR